MAKSYKQKLAYKISKFGTMLLRLLPAELSHDIALWLLKNGALNIMPIPQLDFSFDDLKINIPGIGSLKHPIGLAAGFDKNCIVLDALVKMGFAFIEGGTITPFPQVGHPKPRVFRLKDQLALINKIGLENDGVMAVISRLKELNWNNDICPLGISISKNTFTRKENAFKDYIIAFNKIKDYAKFVILNLSSPNMLGLRDLQNTDFIEYLAQELRGYTHQIWIKLDPDLDKKYFQKLIETIKECQYQGVILTNTHKVLFPHEGGLSGQPLGTIAANRLQWAYEVHKGSLPMIACGGILNGIDILERMAMGACAVQIYSTIIYRGPFAVIELLTELVQEMQLRKINKISDIIGSFYL